MMDDFSQDICRVCRCEAQSDRPLFYPCICTGSIKYIHQDCLMQWMRYSHKEYCELCGHRFSFQPIYSPDMPRVLPLRDVAGGLLSAVMKAAKYWFHYSLVGIAWFGIVPLSAYRTYRFMFSGSTFDMILTLPFDIFSTENIAQDALRGCFVVTCTLLSFIGLVWLREQILHGGGPDWLERDEAIVAGNEADEVPAALPNAAARNAAAAEGPADIGVDAAANAAPLDLNNDNHNRQEAPVDVPMDNEAPAQPNPIYEGYEDHFVLARPMHAAPQAANNENAPAAAAAPAAGEQNNDNDNDEPNWNPMEWDRAAEELTWERLLGLDGSMVFMEHVFWIISLNTMFIFTFAFCPYCIGNFVINWLSVWQPEKPLLHFHGLTTTLFGYCNIGFTLVVLHYFAHLFKMSRVRWLLGLCFIVVKVSLLAVVEIGLLPLVSGWWLDICSLPLFDASLNDRKTSFRAGPGTSLFIHWMFGMVYVYYFAAFISLLREVVRPGVLWFLRNLNDPDFSPIQEMIHLPILRHVRRLIASAIIFGCTVLLMLWLPIRILKTIWPNFLPYTLSGDSEVNELSLQLLLLQVILPGFFEQSHTRIWMKALLRLWCICVSWVLGIRSYLLGTGPVLDNEQNGAQRDNHQAMAGAGAAAARPARNLNLAAEHNAFLQRDVPVGFQSYVKPTFFPIRLLGLLFFMCVSLVIASLVTLTVPVWIGRQVMALWSVGSHIANQDVVQNSDELPRAHELYTAAIGTYLCWITSRAIAIAVTLLPQGRAAVVNKLKQWLKVGVSYALPAFIFVLLLGVIPLLFGLILELVLVIPMRVPFYQTPIHFLWQDWALGVLYTKIAIALTLMGPDWRIKRALERAYRDGLREIDLTFIIRDLAKPVITCFGLALAIPYVIAHSLFPIFFTDPMARFEISRGIYPIFLIIVVVVGFVYFEIRQFKKLYVAIKVDKYLVGQRLVNYEHRRRRQEAEAAAAAATIDKGVQTAAGVDAYGIDDNAENIVGVVAEGQLPLARGGDADIEQQQREAQINNILMGEQLL